MASQKTGFLFERTREHTSRQEGGSSISRGTKYFSFNTQNIFCGENCLSHYTKDRAQQLNPDSLSCGHSARTRDPSGGAWMGAVGRAEPQVDACCGSPNTHPGIPSRAEWRKPGGSRKAESGESCGSTNGNHRRGYCAQVHPHAPTRDTGSATHEDAGSSDFYSGLHFTKAVPKNRAIGAESFTPYPQADANGGVPQEVASAPRRLADDVAVPHPCLHGAPWLSASSSEGTLDMDPSRSTAEALETKHNQVLLGALLGGAAGDGRTHHTRRPACNEDSPRQRRCTQAGMGTTVVAGTRSPLGKRAPRQSCTSHPVGVRTWTTNLGCGSAARTRRRTRDEVDLHLSHTGESGEIHLSFCNSSERGIQTCTLADTVVSEPGLLHIHRDKLHNRAHRIRTSDQGTSKIDPPRSRAPEHPSGGSDADGGVRDTAGTHQKHIQQARIVKDAPWVPRQRIGGPGISGDCIADSCEFGTGPGLGFEQDLFAYPPLQNLLHPQEEHTCTSSRPRLTREMITARWPKKHHTQDPEALSWPLHVKQTSRLSWDKLDELIHPTLRAAWNRHAKYFSVTSALLGNCFPIDEREADTAPGDTDSLLQHRYIERTHRSQVRGTVRVFWVPEPQKKRRRLVTHPVEQNNLPIETEVDLFPSDEEILAGGLKPVAANIDMVAFFNQFELPEYLRDYFCFKSGGQWYRLATIPTGGREPPMIAQIVLKSLALRIQEATKVHATAFIDNLRFAGKPSQVEKALRLVYHICKTELGMQINEPFDMNLISNTYTFLGIAFEKGKVSIGEAAITRLRASSPIHEKSTLRECMISFGRLMSASKILQLSVPYHIVKFLRSRVGHVLDEPANVWPCLLPQWEQWLLAAKDNNPRDITRPNHGTTIYTDASMTGWGAVKLGTGGLSIVAGRWSISESTLHINALELLAVAKAVIELNLRDTCLNIRIDNTTALAHIKRRLATPGGFWLSAAKTFVARTLAERGIQVTSAKWIQSADNIADEPSRAPDSKQSTMTRANLVAAFKGRAPT